MSSLITPSGGWKYEINKVIIIANSFQELVSNVTYHLQSNGKEVGNVQLIIANQIKEKNPSYFFQIDPVAIALPVKK